MKNKREDVLENYWMQINGTNVELGKTDYFFGWDVEYGKLPVQVQDFSTTKYLITNAEYYNFIKNGGYSKTEYWSEEGVKWLKFQTLNRPVFWNQTMDKLRLLTKEIDMPWDWPVEVNYLESKAYCNWLCNEKNTHVRLLSEAEWYILRGNFKEEEIKANINLDHFASSCPVDKFEHNFGVFDVVGNVWQWTETHVDAFPGFKVHPTYNDFSSPTFDNNHNIIKGGSWISTGNETIKSSRYAFRRHFYQHAGFRCVIGKPIAYSNIHFEQDSEVIKWISTEYETEMYKRLDTLPFFETIPEELKEIIKHQNERALVLGYKTGGLCVSLNQIFNEVTGMDQSAYYFKTGVEINNGNEIRYSTKEEGVLTNNEQIKMKIDKPVAYYQNDFYNEFDTKKHKQYDFVMIAHVEDLSIIEGSLILPIIKDFGILGVLIPAGMHLKNEQFPSINSEKLI